MKIPWKNQDLDPNELVELCIGECPHCCFGEDKAGPHILVTRRQYNDIFERHNKMREEMMSPGWADRQLEKMQDAIESIKAENGGEVPEWMKGIAKELETGK